MSIIENETGRRSTESYCGYVLVYSSIEEEQRTPSVVGTPILTKYGQSTAECMYHSDRILKIKTVTG